MNQNLEKGGLWSSLSTRKYLVQSYEISLNAASGFLHSLLYPSDTQNGLSLAISVLRNIQLFHIKQKNSDWKG